MNSCLATLESVSPYSQSRYYDKEEIPMKKDENHNEYERRTWRNRMHVDETGKVFIPGMAFANSIKEGARRKAVPIGKGRKLYTAAFQAGVMVTTSLSLPMKAEDVPFERLFLNSDGQRGGGTRVPRYMPKIDHWKGEVLFVLLDDSIPPAVFEEVLRFTGQLVGIGRFRPQNLGYYGRFRVNGMKFLDEAQTMKYVE
jgi:hypothetical protein